MKKSKYSTATKNTVGSRIALLRAQRHLGQKELANELSSLTDRETPFSVSLISSWETGRRMPTPEELGRLSIYFQVTEEYLRGVSDDPDSTEPSDTNRNIEIKPGDLSKFDGRPVYVSFKNLAHEDQFALVNADNKTLIMRNGYINFASPNIKAIYVSEPDYAYFMSKSGQFPLDMNGLINTESHLIWVEVTSTDPIVQRRYNGWYKKNEDNTALISPVGYALPYEGLNVSYNAYLRRDS